MTTPEVTYAEPPDAVLGLHLVLVGHPVSVPPPEGGRIVHANGVDVLDLKSSTFQLVDEPAQRSGSVRTWEDVLVHEQAPDEVLVLPRLSKTSDLQEEDTVVVQHVVNLLQELGEVTDTDMLGHLKAGDLVVAALRDWDVPVVHAQDVTLLLRYTDLAHGVIAPGRLVAPKGDTSSLRAVIGTGKAGQGAPAAANIQEPFALLETDLLAYNSQLVVLELLKALLGVDVGDNSGRIDHTGP